MGEVFRLDAFKSAVFESQFSLTLDDASSLLALPTRLGARFQVPVGSKRRMGGAMAKLMEARKGTKNAIIRSNARLTMPLCTRYFNVHVAEQRVLVRRADGAACELILTWALGDPRGCAS